MDREIIDALQSIDETLKCIEKKICQKDEIDVERFSRRIQEQIQETFFPDRNLKELINRGEEPVGYHNT